MVKAPCPWALVPAVTDAAVLKVSADKAGVVKVGEVAKATVVPLPLVLYEVPQADPVELAIPAPG
ncbi:MAG: hypothetical protein EBZ60_10095 [Betaproteobacteria bacterium]|nr:hypothetical protein [Betaproteobacteria bacterium]